MQCLCCPLGSTAIILNFEFRCMMHWLTPHVNSFHVHSSSAAAVARINRNSIFRARNYLLCKPCSRTMHEFANNDENQFGAFLPRSSLLSLSLVYDSHMSCIKSNKWVNINKDYSFLHNNYHDRICYYSEKVWAHIRERLHEQHHNLQKEIF